MKYATFLAVIMVASPASAEDCKAYPPGPQRLACASAAHPGMAAKRERCKQEGEGAGLSNRKTDQALKEYVVACMHRH
jgi:hypothetical protein